MILEKRSNTILARRLGYRLARERCTNCPSHKRQTLRAAPVTRLTGTVFRQLVSKRILEEAHPSDTNPKQRSTGIWDYLLVDGKDAESNHYCRKAEFRQGNAQNERASTAIRTLWRVHAHRQVEPLD